jgi:hypothetical protein
VSWSPAPTTSGEEILAHLQGNVGPRVTLALTLELLGFAAVCFLAYLYRLLHALRPRWRCLRRELVPAPPPMITLRAAWARPGARPLADLRGEVAEADGYRVRSMGVVRP